ncbi:MAG: hypothetical protein IPP23_12480, partial [Sphingomonadales bacterium]|nr:hypothetical protein [Sphingomonadales bacterium]
MKGNSASAVMVGGRLKSSPAISFLIVSKAEGRAAAIASACCAALLAPDTERLAFAGRLHAQKAERRVTIPGNSVTLTLPNCSAVRQSCWILGDGGCGQIGDRKQCHYGGRMEHFHEHYPS